MNDVAMGVIQFTFFQVKSMEIALLSGDYDMSTTTHKRAIQYRVSYHKASEVPFFSPLPHLSSTPHSSTVPLKELLRLCAILHRSMSLFGEHVHIFKLRHLVHNHKTSLIIRAPAQLEVPDEPLCCKPRGRPRAHPSKMKVRMKVQVMTKRCCATAEQPPQHCSEVSAPVRGCT